MNVLKTMLFVKKYLLNSFIQSTIGMGNMLRRDCGKQLFPVE